MSPNVLDSLGILHLSCKQKTKIVKDVFEEIV